MTPTPRKPGSRVTPAVATRSWSDTPRPLRALVVIAIAALSLYVYEQAHAVIFTLLGILLLFVFAAIIAMLLDPVFGRMQRVPPFAGRRGWTVLAVNLILLAAVATAVVLLAPVVMGQATNFVHSSPQHVDQVRAFAARAQGWLNSIGVPLVIDIPKGMNAVGSRVVSSAASVVGGTASFIVDLVLIGVIAIYFEIEGRELIDALRKLLPRQLKGIDFAVVAAGSTVAAYVRGQLVMAAIIGVYTGVAMTLLGVHYAVFIGIAAFVLEFLPLVGAVMAMALAVVIALFQSPGLALLAGLAGLVGHAIEAYIVGPRVTGHVTRLHPLAAMVAMVVGAQLGGLLGALFAVPVAGIANVYLGALYKSRRGEDAFYLRDQGDTALADLPSLGHEIDRAPEPGSRPGARPGPPRPRAGPRARQRRPAA